MRFLIVATSLILAHFARAEFALQVEYLHCSNGDAIRAEPQALRFEKRQANVCGAPCATKCFAGAPGTGSITNECTVIAGALLYDSQNVGALLTMDSANNTTMITMQYRSCKTFILNQTGVPLQYCRSAWSELVNALTQSCSATQNAHGGNCVANDQRWFVQVQRP